MQKYLCFFMIVLLTGCAGGDPHSLIAQGEGYLAATDAAGRAMSVEAQATAQAVAASERQNQLEARGTAMALELQATSAAGRTTATIGAAQAMLAQATAQSAALEATQGVRLQIMAAQATEQRIQSLQTAEAQATERAERWGSFMFNVGSALMGIAGLGLTVALIRFSWWLSSAAIEWQDRRRRVMATPTGPMVLLIYPDGSEAWTPAHDVSSIKWRRQPWLIPNSGDRIDVADAAPVIENYPGEEDTVDNSAALARSLVIDAIEVLGPDANVIPSWRMLKQKGKHWSSEPWQAAKRWIEEHGGAVVDQGRTKLTPAYPSLYMLSVEMMNGTLSPTPKKYE